MNDQQPASNSGVALRGSRVVLRDWRIEDVAALVHWNQPGRKWREFDGPYYPRPTAAEAEERAGVFRRRIEAAEYPNPRERLALASVEDDSLIGSVSRYWQSEETQWLSLGIQVFDPELWGRGIGYEALGLWGQYVLDTLPELPRLDLRTWSGNERMMRLAVRLGYSLEARFRDARVVKGERYDAVGYGILRAEWRARYSNGFAAHVEASAE